MLLLDRWIESAADEVQRLVNLQFARAGVMVQASALDQAGLHDGKEIIRDYLDHGEPGLALEHVLYMIEELDLTVSETTFALIAKAGVQMGMPTSTWANVKHAQNP